MLCCSCKCKSCVSLRRKHEAIRQAAKVGNHKLVEVPLSVMKPGDLTMPKQR